ncbi:unnamed protein product [Caenorhabditis nigoni]
MFHCDYQIINDHPHKLGFRIVMAQRVPYDLSPFQKTDLIESILFTPQRKEFLADLLTVDGSWILCNNITHHGIRIPREFIPQGTSITASTYRYQLGSLDLALQEKLPRRTTIHLLRDIARPLVTKETLAKLQKLGGTTVSYL